MRWKKANIEDICPEGGKGDTGADTSVPIAGKPTPLIKLKITVTIRNAVCRTARKVV